MLKNIYYILIFTLLTIFVSFLINISLEHFNILDADLNSPSFFSLTQEIFLTVIVAPLLETFIFQFLFYYIIKIFYKFLGHYFNFIYIIISATLFGLSHKYSIYYQIGTFFFGLIFSYSFIFFKTKFNSPFISVCIVHSLYNLFTTIMEY